MKFICYKPVENNFPSYIVEKVDGVFLQYQLSQFLDKDGNFTGASLIKNDILKIAGQKKTPILGVRFGAACGNWIYDHYPYVEVKEKPVTGQIMPLQKFPVPYDPEYLKKVKAFIEWLSIQLKDVLKHVLYIKPCGMQQFTHEIRIEDEDYSGTTNQLIAQKQAAGKLFEKGYAVQKVKDAITNIFSWHKEFFPNTLIIPAIIPGLTGFPCIDENGNICDPMNRPHIDDFLISEAQYFHFGIQTTAWSWDKSAPLKILKSFLPLSAQLMEQEFNKTVPKEKFEAAIKLMIENKVQFAEIYQQNIIDHYETVIKKYTT